LNKLSTKKDTELDKDGCTSGGVVIYDAATTTLGTLAAGTIVGAGAGTAMSGARSDAI